MTDSMGDMLDRQWGGLDVGDLGTWNPADRCWDVKTTEHWRVVVVPQLFNFRIVIIDAAHDWRNHPATAGWCYDQSVHAFLAAHVWDPETEVRPAGFKKEATDARGGSLL